MAHVLIVGTTRSGKSTCAKQLSHAYTMAPLVLDPKGTGGWRAAFQTTDPHRFLQVAQTSRNCALFIDEAAHVIGWSNPELEWLATQSAGYGHLAHFITQDPKGCRPVVRDQCSEVLAFKLSARRAELLAEDWARAELLEVGRSDWPQYRGRRVPRFGPVADFWVSPPGGG